MNIASIMLQNIINKLKISVDTSVTGVSNANTKLDSILSKTVPIEDIPAFYAVSQYHTSAPSFAVLSHDMTILHNDVRNGSNTGSSVVSEAGNNYYTYSRSNTVASSNNASGSLTTACTIFGHNSLDLASDNLGLLIKNPHTHVIYKSAGCRVGNRKYSNNIPMLLGGNKLFLSKRNTTSALLSSESSVDVPSLSTSVVNGAICFNSNTNRVVMIKSIGASTTFKILYCDMTKDISEFATMQDFVTEFEANKTETVATYSSSSTSGGATNYEFSNITLCDDHSLYVCHAIASVGLSTLRIQFSGGSYSGTAAETVTSSTTTIYGVSPSNMLGLQKNISNNGRYTMSIASYYYYGSGLLLHIFDTQTTRMAIIKYVDSTYGYQCIPLHKKRLIINKSINADGNVGHTTVVLDFEEIFASSALSEFTYTPPAFKQNVITNGYHSTDYPYLVQVTTQDFQAFKE